MHSLINEGNHLHDNVHFFYIIKEQMPQNCVDTKAQIIYSQKKNKNVISVELRNVISIYFILFL